VVACPQMLNSHPGVTVEPRLGCSVAMDVRAGGVMRLHFDICLLASHCRLGSYVRSGPTPIHSYTPPPLGAFLPGARSLDASFAFRLDSAVPDLRYCVVKKQSSINLLVIYRP